MRVNICNKTHLVGWREQARRLKRFVCVAVSSQRPLGAFALEPLTILSDGVGGRQGVEITNPTTRPATTTSQLLLQK